MPTLPSEPEKAPAAAAWPSPPSGQPSHTHRQVAEGFGADAGRYDRARPSYPADLVNRIIAASPGRDVPAVWCGCGTPSPLFQAAVATVLGRATGHRRSARAMRAGT